MFIKYRSSDDWSHFERDRKVIARMVDFRAGIYNSTRCIEVYEYDPERILQYDVVFPLVDIRFNGMLLKAGIYYYDYAGWIDERVPPCVELA